MLTIWPYLVESPVSTHWGWSPIIHDAYEKNKHLFEPRSRFFARLFGSQEDTRTAPIPGLLAIHVRRGDFIEHCENLAKWGADWNAFNSFPEFPDKFGRPTEGKTEAEMIELYVRRCYPSIEQIVEKVREVRKDAAEPLRYLYIMTNGRLPWVEELKSALRQDMSWVGVSSSRDLEITWEQKFVAQALDMYVGQRAQVLIGNGVSALLSDDDLCVNSAVISGPA